MSLLVLVTLVLWGGGMAAALWSAGNLLVLEEAEPGRARLRGQVLARGSACLAAGLGLASLSALASITSDFRDVWRFMLPTWAACSAPLLLPTGRAPFLGIRVSPLTLVGISIALTIAFGLAIALYLLLRLVLSHPELV